MKRYLLLCMMLGTVLFFSCSEQEIEPFGNRHEVYFEKCFMDESAPGTAKADSTNVTFFFAKPTDDHVMVDLVVVLAGRVLTQDVHFGLKVVDEMTTATPDEYTLEDSYTFRARSIPEGAKMISDTIQIRMNKSKRLDDLKDGVRLVLELIPSEEAFVGQFEHSRAVIHLTKDAVRPLWWTKEVEAYLLGPYSSLKYKTFLQNIDGAYGLNELMIKERPDRARKLVSAFKLWLYENPIYDDDNYGWMYVNV